LNTKDFGLLALNSFNTRLNERLNERCNAHFNTCFKKRLAISLRLLPTQFGQKLVVGLFSSAVALTYCGAPAFAQAPAAPPPAEKTVVENSPAVDEIRPEDRFETMPPLTLTGPLMREMLLAEIRSNRGETMQAAQTYISLANSLKDSRFARRATQWLLRSQQFEPAFGAAQVWIRLAPQSPNAQQVYDGLAIASNNYVMLETVFLARLNKVASEKNGVDLEATYTGLLRSLLQAPDPKGAAAFLDKIADSKSANPLQRAAGFTAKANWKIASRDLPAAQRDVDAALAASNQYSPAVWLALQLAANDKNADMGRKTFEQYLQFPMPLTPSHGEARLLYGALLEELGKSQDALTLLATTGTQDTSYLRTQLRVAALRTKDGKIDAALQGLSAVSANQALTLNDADKTLVARATGQILREAKRDQEALVFLTKALQEQPEQTDLLYEQAMTAERLKQFDLMEQQLRTLITIKPDQALAYNALGYSLADRGIRLDEAEELIRNALSLRPDDGMLIDSLGWVFFKQRKYPQALEQLQDAYKRLPDGEIAAHLGEVHWEMGQKDKAREVWKDALTKEPKHPVLLETLKRFDVKVEPANR
jgi:tetratricopeptide (TPR) repeat protein